MVIYRIDSNSALFPVAYSIFVLLQFGYALPNQKLDSSISPNQLFYVNIAEYLEIDSGHSNEYFNDKSITTFAAYQPT